MTAYLKTAAFALILLCPVLLPAQVLSGDTWEATQKRKSGKITAVFLEEDSFAYRTASGQPAGVEIDIFHQFVNWLKHTRGITLEVDYVAEPDFQKFYSTVRKAPPGTVGLGTVTILDRRRKEVQFTPPFINNVALLVTHSSVPELTKLSQISSEFAGKTAVIARGTTLQEYTLNLRAMYFPNLKVEYVSSQMEVLRRVASDPSAFAYMDLSVYWPAFDRQEMPVKRHPVGDLSSESFGFILPLESDWNTPLTEFFNIGSGYRGTVAYKNILMKHLGMEVTRMLHLTQRPAVAVAGQPK